MVSLVSITFSHQMSIAVTELGGCGDHPNWVDRCYSINRLRWPQINLIADSYIVRDGSATCNARVTHSSKSYIMTTGKLLSAAVAFAVLVGTPALAATAHKGKTSHAAYASQTQSDTANLIIGWDGRVL